VTSCGQSRRVPGTDRLLIPTGAEDLLGERVKAEPEREKIPFFLHLDVKFQRRGKSYNTLAL